MTQKFLDQAGLVALWAKIKALINTVSNSIGNGALKVSSNSGTATQATTMNEASDKTLQIKGDGTWITGAVSGSANAAAITLSHGGPSTGSALTTSNGTASAVPNAGTEVTVLTGVTASADSKGHITGVSTTRQKIKTPNNGELSINTKVGSTTTEVADFTADQAENDSITFEQGTNVTLTPDTTNKKITVAHATPSGASAQSTAVFKKLKWDSQGHIIGTADVTNSDLPVPVNDGTFSVKTKVGTAAAVTAADFTANQSGADDITFIQGKNIVLTTDTTNRTITITASDAPEQVAPNDATLTVNGDTGSQAAFSADEESAKDLSIVGDTTFIGTAVTSGTDETIVTVSHKNPTGGSVITEPTTTPTTYNAANSAHKLLSGFALTANNGHVTAVTPTYMRIENATESMPGLMSAADKAALNGMQKAIATALTSAITPKGSITAADLNSQKSTLLTSTGLGDLYQLSSPLVIGPAQSGDTAGSYIDFVEGGSLTQNNTVRHEIPAGSYVMVVNTGTESNPNYKFDIVSGLYDSSFLNRAIPVDTSDPDYDGPNTTEDPTVDSICV